MKKILLLGFSLFSIIVNGQNYKDLLIEYQKGDYSYVIEYGVPLCKQSPKDIDLMLLLGRAYADNKQFEEAMPYLRNVDQNANKKGWRRGWGEIYLGICNYGLGQYEWAKTYLNRAATDGDTDNIRRFANKQLYLLGLHKSFDKFRIKETEQIVFHFHPDVAADIEFVDNYIKVNNQLYTSAHNFFNCKAPKKIDLFVWPDKNTMNQVLNEKSTSIAEPSMCLVHTIKNNKSCEEIALVISYYISNIKEQKSLITYGIAAYLVNGSNSLLDEAKNAVKTSGVKMISIADIWSVDRSNSELVNIVSAAFVEYLIQAEGKEKFIELYKDQSYNHAKQIYGAQLDQLIKDFEQKLMQG